jgi:hypothetical protein
LLRVHAPHAELEAELHQAAAHLEAVSTHRRDPQAAVWSALALLALGNFRPARTVISELPGVDRSDLPLSLLLVSRYVASSGDLSFVHGCWPRVLQAIESARLNQSATTQHELWPAALLELSVAAESIGLGNSLDPIDPHPHPQTASASAQLEQNVEGLSTETAGAVRFVLQLVNGLLGFEPDAPRHRVRLRPALPPAWRFFEAANLRLGDNTIALVYSRDDRRHTFRVAQTYGAFPLRLVLEPVLVASGIAAISIDGTPASLDHRVAGDRVVCPVQIVLDHDRELLISTA